MKILSPTVHGLIDYLVVIFLWASPTIFGIAGEVAMFTYALGGVHLALTAFTDFPAGAVKLIPLRIHGLIELIVSVALVGIAFYFGATHGALAQNFYLGFAAAVFVTWLISDYSG